jgi:hypothetical protein
LATPAADQRLSLVTGCPIATLVADRALQPVRGVNKAWAVRERFGLSAAAGVTIAIACPIANRAIRRACSRAAGGSALAPSRGAAAAFDARAASHVIGRGDLDPAERLDPLGEPVDEAGLLPYVVVGRQVKGVECRSGDRH